MENLLGIISETFKELWSNNRIAVIIGLVIIAVLLLIIIIRILSKAKERKKYKKFFKKKLWELERDESLNNAIEIGSDKKGKEKILLQLQEKSPISKREHFFQLSDSHVLIGASSMSCHIFLNDRGVDEVQCMIEATESGVIVKSYSDKNITTVKRSKLLCRKRRVELKRADELTIKTKDRIILGSTEFIAVIYSDARGLI